MTKRKETKKIKVAVGDVAQKKEILFIDEYLQDFNGRRAYMQVYATNSPTVAGVEASKLLKRPSVKAYLDQCLRERRESLQADQAYVVRKALEIVESDFYSASQEMTRIQLENLPMAIRKLVQSVESIKTSSRNGDTGYESESERFKVTFMSKDKALDMLAKHTGAYAKDNVSMTKDISGMTFTDALKELDI